MTSFKRPDVDLVETHHGGIFLEENFGENIDLNIAWYSL